MKNDNAIFYWDSCLFLSYINGEPGRSNIFEDLLDEVERNKGEVFTSTIAIVEVAYASRERLSFSLSTKIQNQINEIWADPYISLVEFNRPIAELARQLIRDAIPNKWVLKPKDAVHLASALWVNNNISKVNEFCTYDDGLAKYTKMIGIQIKAPHVSPSRLL
jgi:predicted nucleic acid-binding protein